MDVGLTRQITAIIVRDPALVTGGGAPVFITESIEQQQHVAFMIGRIVDGMVHDLENGVLIVVRH